jgi:hypothetical protein
VGQGAREEITVQLASSAGGENYGWRLREGTIATPSGGVGGAKPAGAIDPIYDYVHVSGQNSITGGYVYRGPVTSLQGRYFFADFARDEIWSLVWDGSHPSTFDGTNFGSFIDHTGTPDFAPDVGTLTSISSFGEDAAGNLYLLSLGGDVFRITATLAPVPAISPGGGLLLAGALLACGLWLLRSRYSRSHLPPGAW